MSDDLEVKNADGSTTEVNDSTVEDYVTKKDKMIKEAKSIALIIIAVLTFRSIFLNLFVFHLDR
jgi:hypothetical protein